MPLCMLQTANHQGHGTPPGQLGVWCGAVGPAAADVGAYLCNSRRAGGQGIHGSSHDCHQSRRPLHASVMAGLLLLD